MVYEEFMKHDEWLVITEESLEDLKSWLELESQKDKTSLPD